MTIQVNSILTKSRNPTEHGFKLEGEKGNIVQILPDGFNLVEFKQFNIQKKMKFGKIKKTRMAPLQWYINFDDITFLP